MISARNKNTEDFILTDHAIKNDQLKIFKDFDSADVLNDFLENTHADIFSPCAVRYAIDNRILSTLKWKTFSQNKSVKKYIISGGNNVFKNSSVTSSCLQQGIDVIPEWFSSCGNALYFLSILRQDLHSTENVDQIKRNIRQRVINFLETASKKLAPNTTMYEAIFEMMYSQGELNKISEENKKPEENNNPLFSTAI